VKGKAKKKLPQLPRFETKIKKEKKEKRKKKKTRKCAEALCKLWAFYSCFQSWSLCCTGNAALRRA